MLIMDQIRENLFELSEMFICKNMVIRTSDGQILGEYCDFERAKKVLENIVEAAIYDVKIFKMPKK